MILEYPHQSSLVVLIIHPIDIRLHISNLAPVDIFQVILPFQIINPQSYDISLLGRCRVK